MKRNNKGSVAIVVYVVMLFISLYGALILGNSSRRYLNQTQNIETIQNAYNFQGGDDDTPSGKEITQQELENLYLNVGGVVIDVD